MIILMLRMIRMIILMLRMIRMIILMLRMIILMGQDDGSWFMAHGPRLMAHGSWPRGAGPALEPGGAPGPDPAGPETRGPWPAMNHEP